MQWLRHLAAEPGNEVAVDDGRLATSYQSPAQAAPERGPLGPPGRNNRLYDLFHTGRGEPDGDR